MPVVIDAYGNRHPFGKMSVDRYIELKTKKRLNGCIEWYGKITWNGYPEFPNSIAQREGFWLVYHYTWFVKTGRRVSKPMSLDHICENRRCINVKHLREMTLKENVLRGKSVSAINSRKTHCPAGHLYDVVNIDGDRTCRRCLNDSARRWRERNREKINRKARERRARIRKEKRNG